MQNFKNDTSIHSHSRINQAVITRKSFTHAPNIAATWTIKKEMKVVLVMYIAQRQGCS